MKIAIEVRKRCNIPAKREGLRTVSQKKGVDESKNLMISPYLTEMCH